MKNYFKIDPTHENIQIHKNAHQKYLTEKYILHNVRQNDHSVNISCPPSLYNTV